MFLVGEEGLGLLLLLLLFMDLEIVLPLLLLLFCLIFRGLINYEFDDYDYADSNFFLLDFFEFEFEFPFKEI